MPSPDDRALRVQVLGPVRARCDGQELDLGPPQRRAILVALAMAAGRTVSRQDLIDRVWDNPTDKADSSLHTHISRLRKVLDPGRDHEILAGGRTGYVLRVGPGQVDALAFTAGVTAARREREAGDLASAAQSLAAALELWQGTALAGVEGQWAGTERVRLEEARLAAEEEHAAVQLALGRHCEVTPELAGLVRRHPLREELRCLLMLALYRSGRQADALAVFHDTRRVLDEELGIEPGPALRRLHGQVLAADPALLLTAQPGPAEPGPAEPGPAQSGSAQSGSAQPGPAQSGSAQSGSAQSGSAQSGSAQSGSAQSGSAQSGSAQPGPAQPVAGGGPARPADMAGV
ncbi:MAG TPA: BTAD domain-containing putative transcriptional regulator, partial [Streptosporangiaceae bacterium]|nr:BTAD domain-containing putative transcriptional regulator [Streptosporangiaceae bacterium]